MVVSHVDLRLSTTDVIRVLMRRLARSHAHLSRRGVAAKLHGPCMTSAGSELPRCSPLTPLVSAGSSFYADERLHMCSANSILGSHAELATIGLPTRLIKSAG